MATTDKDLRDHVISTSVSLGVGALGFLASSFFPDRAAEGVALAIGSGIITHLIFDRIAYQRTLETTRNEIIETLRVGAPFEAGYRVFDKEQDAVSYLVAMLPSATKIWNTRISDHSSVFGMRFKSGIYSEHDTAILSAIRNGAECKFVIQDQRRPEIDHLISDCKSASESKDGGGLIVYSVDFAYQPVTQMLIFETKDGNGEALIGWGMGKESDFQAKVLSFRDKVIVDFYKNMFDRYTIGAKIEKF